MDRLAYIIITITSPPQYAGEEWITAEPEHCLASSAYIELFEGHSFEADARCIYTLAPATSPRPQERPNAD